MKLNRFSYPTSFGFGNNIGRLIQDALGGLEDLGGRFSASQSTDQAPRADLYEDEHHYFVTAELPGVSKSEVDVKLVKGILDISASVSRETADGRKNISFKRSIALPDQVGDAEIRAKLEDGVLTVTLPKALAAQPRSITVE